MNVNSRPAFRRQFHRRFSEPQIYNTLPHNPVVSDAENDSQLNAECDEQNRPVMEQTDPELVEMNSTMQNNKDDSRAI